MKAEYLIYFCSGIDSVFDSQVLELLKSINSKKAFKKVYLLMGIRNDTERQNFNKRSIPSDMGVIFFKSYPNYPLFNWSLRKELNTVLRNNNLILDNAIYHTRHEILAWHLSKIMKNEYFGKIIPDIRGATIEEISEFSGLNSFYKYLKIYNYKRALNSLRIFKKLSAVTEPLKNYLTDKFSVKPDNISVIPCLAGKNFNFDIVKRNKIRESLNLSPDDVLLLYATGGTDKWHDNSVVTSLANKGIKFLNLSKNNIDHDNVINKFVSYSEMPGYLNAVDASIIWRPKSTVNEVASPVKFSEYLCCGLPVIANDAVELISDYIKTNQHGFLSEDEENIDLSKMIALKSINRYDISAKGTAYFGIENITYKYLELYSSL